MNHQLPIVVLTAVLAGCAARDTPRTVVPASDAQRASLLDQVKQLEGTWEMPDENGKMRVSSVFTVGSGGSAVREVLFPGGPEEMTNMYHMDGPTLVMTHYCAIGNQPRMRATAGAPGVIDFRFDSVTNFTNPDQEYMGEVRLVTKDKNTLREEWRSLRNGVPTGEPTVFEMKRKK